jgi:hypothetical protein
LTLFLCAWKNIPEVIVLILADQNFPGIVKAIPGFRPLTLVVPVLVLSFPEYSPKQPFI